MNFLTDASYYKFYVRFSINSEINNRLSTV